MFAILFMDLLSGQLHFCGLNYFPTYNVNKLDCIAQGGRWIPYNQNFDNIFNAIVSLFMISSPADWPTLML